MKDRLFQALKKSSADYAEIRYETEDTASLAFRGKDVEGAGTSSFHGGMVRACTRGGWGVVTFDSLDRAEDYVAEACECARLVGREQTMLADVTPVQAEVPAKLIHDFRGVSLDDKLKLISRYNDILLGSSKSIESSHVHYGDRFRTVYFASTRGNYFMEERPRIVCGFEAVARDGSLVQTAHDGLSSITDYNDMLGLDARVLECATRAAALLKAPKCEGGTYSVVLNPNLAGVFIHEAFGHLSEADFIYENPQMREMMCMGREVGEKFLNVIDDGSLPALPGYQAFDDEGTPTGKTYLIKEGKLAGYLHSLETAARMGGKPTGHARAIRRGATPICRMGNTYIDKGDTTVDGLFAGIDKGIYACNAYGGQTALEMFTFSAGHGYRIENGQRGELIRDITMSGNVFKTLKSIDAVGNDLVFANKGGGCGKGDQGPLPVGIDAPHIRIRNVMVGGL